MGKKSCNNAFLSEFGRFPLNIKVLVNTCKYLQRLLSTDFELLQGAYKESCGKMSWASCVDFLLKELRMPKSMAYQPNFSSLIKAKLINRFKENLMNSLNQCKEMNKGKLRTYALFKTIFQKEEYLSVIQDVYIRKCFMAFRISSHRLEIERGRYKNLPIEKRLCAFCSSDSVEDENIYFSIAVCTSLFVKSSMLRYKNHANTFQAYHKSLGLSG